MRAGSLFFYKLQPQLDCGSIDIKVKAVRRKASSSYWLSNKAYYLYQKVGLASANDHLWPETDVRKRPKAEARLWLLSFINHRTIARDHLKFYTINIDVAITTTNIFIISQIYPGATYLASISREVKQITRSKSVLLN